MRSSCVTSGLRFRRPRVLCSRLNLTTFLF
jgi:hypothetical protein